MAQPYGSVRRRVNANGQTVRIFECSGVRVCGRSNAEIAERLHISVETVKSHMRQSLVRMGARNRTELATIYQRSR